MVVLWRATERARRVGFAVSRQIRDAVRRNRARRRLREAYRRVREAAPERVDLVIIGKQRCLDEDFAVLTGEVRAALEALPGRRGSRCGG